MNRLSFSVGAEGDVWLVVRSLGAAPTRHHVTATEAKRFAWALLADLDPDEADASGLPAAREPRERGMVHERERTPYNTQHGAILSYLSRVGEADTRQIAGAVDISVQQASVILSKLGRRELVTKLTRGLAGYPSLWKVGPVSFEDYEAAKRAARACPEIPNEPVRRHSLYRAEAGAA